jgi:hypothetical protein
VNKERAFPGIFNPFTQVEIWGKFPSSGGSRSEYSTFSLAWGFPNSLENRKISPFHFEWEKKLSLDTMIFNTCATFHLLTNTSKENEEISPFLKGVKKRLSLDTIIFNTFGTFHLLTNTSKENTEISLFVEGLKIDTPHSMIVAS